MKLIADRKKLSSILEKCDKGVPNQVIIGVMGGILMEIKDGKATLTGASMEQGVRITLPVEATEDCKVVVPNKLVQIVKYFPGEQVEMELQESKLIVKSGDSKVTLNTMSAEEYPNLFEAKEALDAPDIFNTLRVSFCTSKEASRPAFQAVVMDGKCFYASDTYRMAYIDHGEKGDEQLLLPAKGVGLFAFLDPDGDITVEKGEKGTLLVSQDDEEGIETKIMLRLYEEKYPNIEGIFPTEFSTTFKVSTKELRETIARAQIIEKQGVLDMNENGLTLSAKGETGDMNEVVPVEEFQGDNVNLMLNLQFLLEGLPKEDKTQFKISTGNNYGNMVVVTNEAGDYRYLVLPIKKEQ